MGERKCIPQISHARVNATPRTLTHNLHCIACESRLKELHALHKHTHPTASERAWECERELHFPCECRLKHREDIHIHTYYTHTHTRTARSVLQLREQNSLTLIAHLQRKLDLCVSLSVSRLFWGCSFSQPFAGVKASLLSQLKTRCCCVWFVQQLTVSRRHSLHMRNVASRVQTYCQ